jgi:MFS family permease
MMVTPLGFATSLLDPRVGQVSSATMMLCAMISSLLIGVPAVQILGTKVSLVIAQSMNTVYAIAFPLGILLPDGSFLQWVTLLTGAFLAGITSGVSWTAQGSFFADSSSSIAERDGFPREEITARLSCEFASVLLVTEITVKLGASLLQGSFLWWKIAEPLMNITSMFFLFAATAGAMLIVMALAVNEPPRRQTKTATVIPAKAAIELWSSPVLWCLAGTNLTFGFSVAYMQGYVNAVLVKSSPTFGVESIGALMAVPPLVAVLVSTLLGGLSQKTGKSFIVAIGAASFFCIALTLLADPPTVENGYWGRGLVLPFVLQGVGRGVYEGTNKAMFADFFQGPQSTGAFANAALQGTFALFASFVLQTVLVNKSVLAWIVLVLAGLTVPGQLLASALHQMKQKEKAPPQIAGDGTERLLGA